MMMRNHVITPQIAQQGNACSGATRLPRRPCGPADACKPLRRSDCPAGESWTVSSPPAHSPATGAPPAGLSRGCDERRPHQSASPLTESPSPLLLPPSPPALSLRPLLLPSCPPPCFVLRRRLEVRPTTRDSSHHLSRRTAETGQSKP